MPSTRVGAGSPSCCSARASTARCTVGQDTRCARATSSTLRFSATASAHATRSRVVVRAPSGTWWIVSVNVVGHSPPPGTASGACASAAAPARTRTADPSAAWSPAASPTSKTPHTTDTPPPTHPRWPRAPPASHPRPARHAAPPHRPAPTTTSYRAPRLVAPSRCFAKHSENPAAGEPPSRRLAEGQAHPRCPVKIEELVNDSAELVDRAGADNVPGG
jgi:hypothetical protein